jgi:hypothetical protein
VSLSWTLAFIEPLLHCNALIVELCISYTIPLSTYCVEKVKKNGRVECGTVTVKGDTEVELKL